jgi:hypothetical protein
MAAGPRPCYRAALASDQIRFAGSDLSSLRSTPNPMRPVHRDWLELKYASPSFVLHLKDHYLISTFYRDELTLRWCNDCCLTVSPI